MKTTCTFHFQDEPQYQVPERREYIAHRMRCWRSAKCSRGLPLFNVQRLAVGMYQVTTLRGGFAVAIVNTRVQVA